MNSVLDSVGILYL